MSDTIRALDAEIDARLAHLLDGKPVAFDIPERIHQQHILYTRIRARGDALYGARGYTTAIDGPRLILRRAQ